MSKIAIKTRFCPSPTGHIHLGNIRAALLSFLWALKNKGTFLLRIEDTDKERSDASLAMQMMEDLRWLGLNWQEGPDCEGINGPYWQSQRHPIYQAYLEQLLAKDQAYPCFCSEQELSLARKRQRAAGQPPRYPGTCRRLSETEVALKKNQGQPFIIRFKVPEGETIDFVDLIRGEQHFQSDDISDFVIARTDGTAPFFFSNAIDDALMGVNCALRGEDHIANTPRQLMILGALGLSFPSYGHIALIVGPDGAPLSKRNGSQSIKGLREEGYLPLAIVNYLARLGVTYEQDELLSLNELSEHFILNNLSRSAARFDSKQLLYWQKKAVLGLSDQQFWLWAGEPQWPAESRPELIDAIRPNVEFPGDVAQWANCLQAPRLAFQAKDLDILQAAGKNFFSCAIALLHEDIHNLVRKLQEKTGRKGKNLFKPLRIALTGRTDGPELHKIIALLGKGRVQKRLEQAMAQ